MRPTQLILATALVSGVLGRATPAQAIADPGTVAPDFLKNEVVGGAIGPAWTLSGLDGKVVLLFVMGYN